ncbi:MAG: hypothetical protein ACLUQ2_14650, partial [Klebsiella pneumoniae]
TRSGRWRRRSRWRRLSDPFLSRIPAMVPAALADATLRTNPRPVDGAAIAQLLENLQ